MPRDPVSSELPIIRLAIYLADQNASSLEITTVALWLAEPKRGLAELQLKGPLPLASVHCKFSLARRPGYFVRNQLPIG